jgi:hypothetical protein
VTLERSSGPARDRRAQLIGLDERRNVRPRNRLKDGDLSTGKRHAYRRFARTL